MSLMNTNTAVNTVSAPAKKERKTDFNLTTVKVKVLQRLLDNANIAYPKTAEELLSIFTDLHSKEAFQDYGNFKVAEAFEGLETLIKERKEKALSGLSHRSSPKDSLRFAFIKACGLASIADIKIGIGVDCEQLRKLGLNPFQFDKMKFPTNEEETVGYIIRSGMNQATGDYRLYFATWNKKTTNK